MTSEVGQAGKRLRDRMKVKGGLSIVDFFLADVEMMWELFFLTTDGRNLRYSWQDIIY